MTAEEEAAAASTTMDSVISSDDDGGWSYLSLAIFAFTVMTLTALAYDKSHAFRYHLKFAVYVFICSCAAMIMIPFSLFRPRDVRNVL
jgi:hypothetical protein